LLAVIWGGVDMLIFTGGWRLTHMAAISCSIGTVSLFLAVVTARLRHMME
jgi:hypothetical protein